ncbi:MAG: HAD-IA family hydrolase [Clostridia bacterium]|nr:HAD-IA family hydrolase [Clostridia bacterium]
MRKKLILFDWGNIVESHLTGYTCYKAWVDLFKKCGYKDTDEGIFKKLPKYRLSAITTEEEFEETYTKIKKEFEFNVDFKNFVKNYNEIFDKIDYYKDVAEYEVSLKDKCYIGILSNLCIFDGKRLDRQVDLSKYDYAFLSYEMGCKKPDLEMFQAVQDKLPFDKKDILLIDDRTNNVEAARGFGWNVFQATGLELDKIKEVCNKFINQ